MRRRSTLVLSVFFAATTLVGCATPAGDAAPVTHTPSISAPSEGTEAQAQAQAWLDAAALPPGAIPAETSPGRFRSYTGWPRTPVEKLEAFWTIPGASVAEIANWIMTHPTADLVSTAVAPVPDDAEVDSASVGYIPSDGSQQGVVYTIVTTRDAVAVRAEIAALTASSVCPSLPPGATWGAPGQG